jgi:hypothetical protein
MANNIEWSWAGYAPTIADREDVERDGATLDHDEIAVWLGGDLANVLYGTPQDIHEWAVDLANLMNEFKGQQDDRRLIDSIDPAYQGGPA